MSQGKHFAREFAIEHFDIGRQISFSWIWFLAVFKFIYVERIAKLGWKKGEFPLIIESF